VTAPAGVTSLPISITEQWYGGNHPEFGFGTIEVTENYHYLQVSSRTASVPPPVNAVPESGSTTLLSLFSLALLAGLRRVARVA
jgi:hypothetical protein